VVGVGEPPVDAGLLRGFLNDLDAVVLTALEIDGIVAWDVRQGLGQLWSDARESRDFLDRELESVEEGRNPELAERLSNVGLTGSSGAFKLAMFGRRRDEVEAERVGGLSRRLRALLKSLLRWANVILGSMVAAIPGGDAYKEAKEAVEAAVEDAEDEDLQ
jgi:hypothetical protein